MAKAITSPLVSSFNNIAAFNSNTKRSLVKMKGEYNSFSGLIQRESLAIKQIALPKKRKITELASLNTGSLFGTPGSLLSSLVSGALDVAGFLGSMFPGRGQRVGEFKQPSGKPPKPIPRGSKIRFGGLRSIGIVNSIFAGLDFATGLSEGESVGKAAAGAGGSLAGSLLGGAIGQTLIPIPGVGFMIGSAAGGFLGGYMGDRAYEGVTGEKSLEQKQEERLKAQEQLQKGLIQDSALFNSLNRFDEVVDKFAYIAKIGGLGGESDIGPGSETDMVSADKVDDQTGISGEYPGFDNVERVAPFVTGHVSTYPGAQFGAPRKNGRVHAGQDIAGQKEGDPVLATMAGTVVEVGTGYKFQRGGGSSQTIGIKHKDGSMSRYVHVLANVSNGQEVKTGQQIGTISPADVASSPDFPHLHFELYAPGKEGAMDPRPYLKTAPKTPAVAPIKNARASVGPSPAEMKFGANDIASAPVTTIGDSIAQGVKGNGQGRAQQSANPKKVLEFLKSENLQGKLVKLSSGISNDTSDLATVREQLKYAQSQGAKGVQLMGTSFDRADLAKMNPKLQALAQEFPGFVQFAGGFKSTDLIHPDYAQYNQKLNDLIKSGSGGLGVDPSMLDLRTNMGSDVRHYPSYNKPSTSVVLIPVATPSSGGGGGSVVVPSSNSGSAAVQYVSPPQGHLVNSLMKSILLTNLAKT